MDEQEQATTMDSGERGLWVFYPHHGKVKRVRLEREVNWYDEERAEKRLPYPEPPQNKDGAPNFGDLSFLQRRAAVAHERSLFLIAVSFGQANCGGHDGLEARVDWLKSTHKRWQLEHIAKAINDPAELSEAEIEAEMHRLYPTSPTPAASGPA